MNDRLGELQKKRRSTANETVIGLGITTSEDIEIDDLENGGQPKRDNFMESFFHDVDDVKDELARIKEGTKAIARLHQDTLEATTSDAERDLSRQLDGIIKGVKPHVEKAKSKLEVMSKSTAEAEKQKKAKQSEIRIRKNLITTLKKKLVDVFNDYQNAQDKYAAFIKSKIARQMKIVQPDANQEDIDKIIEEGGTADDVIMQAMTKRVNHQVLEEYNRQVQKTQDIKKLLGSMGELQEYMNDMSLLIQEQGELIDSIQEHVNSAEVYIEEANEQLELSIKSQKETRKYQCCFIGFVMVIIAIIVLMIFVF